MVFCPLLLGWDDEGTAPAQEVTAILHCTPVPFASAKKLHVLKFLFNFTLLLISPRSASAAVALRCECE